MTCPLCLDSTPSSFREKKFKWGLRRWLHCQTCDLVFVAPQDRPTPQVELEEYQLHNNSIEDDAYTRHLQTLMNPLTEYISKSSKGLDFGSGPTPVLKELLSKKGYTVDLYDPFFADEGERLTKRYDFITCTEVVEHFSNPRKEFRLLQSLLTPSGALGVLTSLRPPKREFLDWPYVREKSHVSLYSLKTLSWIESSFQLLRVYQKGAATIWKLDKTT